MKSPFAAFGLALAVFAFGSVADAKPKGGGAAAGAAAPTACGYKSIPLAIGNTWTYKAGSAVAALKIVDIGTGKDDLGKPATVIDVQEDYAGRTLKTRWSCSATGGLVVPLDSFFFSGEPGGGAGTTMTPTSRDKAWLPPENELTGDVAWVEVLKADVTRTDGGGAGATHLPGRLEVERHVQLKGTETVTLGIGQLKAQRYFFELRGRAIVEEQKVEIPIKRPGAFWVTPGIGIIKIDDAFDRTWELTESNLIAK
jgi:hypothetical protein